MLAVEAAAQFASLGHRVLLGCWNLVLARWLVGALQTRLEELGSPAAGQVTTDPRGQVVVSHVGALTGRRGVPPEGVDAQAWYLEQLPSGLSPRDTGGDFDVVALDEVQDLSELWVLAISQLVAHEGRWYAFADGQQDLFDADAALPDFLELQHELRDNFRKSRQIAAFAAGFGDVELDCLSGDGPPVRFVAVPGEHVVSRTREVARKLQRDERVADADLTVLWLFHNPFKGANDEVATAALAGERVESNSASFKGMQRPVVVLGLDVDPETARRQDEVARAIFAATRARSLLVVVGDPDALAHLGFHDLADQLRGA